MKPKHSKLHCSKIILMWGMGLPLIAQAEALVDQLNNVFGSNGVQLQINTANPQFNHQAHFSSASVSTLSILTQQLAVSAVDIPAISTVPGLTYRYNSDLQTFERSSGSLGSIYIERPLTLGKGNLEFGFSYTYVGFDTLDGQDLDGLSFRNLQHGDCCGDELPSPGDPGFEAATADLIFDEFSLQSHIFNFSATYGITDNWDVNLLLPIIETSLDVSARAQINDVPFDPPGPDNFPNGVHSFPDGTKSTTASISNSHFGVGDIQLRTKYHFVSHQYFNMAGGINLRLPSGSEEDFQGVGDTTVNPYFSFSGEYGIVDLHAIAGVEFNTGNDKRDRIRYAGGATFQLIPEFALITDFIGSSSIRTNQVSVSVPEFTGGSAIPSSYTTATSIVDNDTLDLALGFKFIPTKSVVGFFNVFIPLNDSGLRADVIPTGGVQVGF